MSSSISVVLSYQGQNIALENVNLDITGEELHQRAFGALELSPNEFTLKLLLKGKRIPVDSETVFTNNNKTKSSSSSISSTKAVKILVMASARTSVEELNAKQQDPTIRGFDQEKKLDRASIAKDNDYWGPEISKPDKNYKFGRLRECPFHDFGHRPTDTTPHAFAARQLLQRLSTDPGVISILQERELVVGTLGEMDPIDDRIMQKKQQERQGSCLLGYNTNRGLRIDIKLRTDDLKTFRPYFQLVETLIHELSHNWVGEHNELFWANFGQMRIEYFMAHKRLQYLRHQGKSSAELAEIPPTILQGDRLLDFCMKELEQEMAQHHLHPSVIAEPIRQRYQELEATVGIRLGGDTTTSSDVPARSLALEAAERRAREQKKNDRKEES